VFIGRIVVVVALASITARAAVLVEYEKTLGPERVTDTVTYPLIVARPDSTYAIDVQAVLREGSGVLRITDPNGAEIYQHLWGDRISQELAPLGPLDLAGEYQIVVDVEGALGHWRVRVAEVPDAAQLRSIALTGPLLGVVGLAFLLGWRFGTRAQWRWFAVGAGARIAAAVLTLAVVLVYHFTVRGTLEDELPYSRYLILDGGVIGVASGIAAVLAFLIAGYMFRGSRKSAPNAIALGVGAGVSETLISSIVTIMGTGLLFGDSPKSEKWMLQLAYDATLTPMLPLVEPAKFICVILCLMAIGGLTLMAIAARRWGLLFPAFLLAAGFYAVLGATPVWALEGAASKWWILAGVLPFGIASVFVVRWCLNEWPPGLAPDEVPMEEFLRESSAVEGGR
jgi:hypothetical protein